MDAPRTRWRGADRAPHVLRSQNAMRSAAGKTPPSHRMSGAEAIHGFTTRQDGRRMGLLGASAEELAIYLAHPPSLVRQCARTRTN